MSMIPGLGSDILGPAGEAESARRLKRCLTIMDSMSAFGTLTHAANATVMMWDSVDVSRFHCRVTAELSHFLYTVTQ